MRTATERYWISLAERPESPPPPHRWTAPVSSSYLDDLRRLDVTPIIRSRWFHAISAELTPSQRTRVRALPCVRRVVPLSSGRSASESASRPPTTKPSLSSPPSVPLQFGSSREYLARMNAVSPMERGFDGRGVRVGFIDANFGGLQHPAFDRLRRQNRMIALRNFTEGPQGGNHGAGVASVAMGHTPGTLVGPGHGAMILGATTEYTPSERNVEEDYFVAGLEWLHRRGADVVNVSVGYNTFDEGQDSYTVEDLDGDTGLTTRAVDRAAQLGVTVVVSAGNSGCASPDSCWYYVNTPADADSAITVGAIRPDSTLAPFSSRGPTADGRHKPDVVVQGVNVTAARDDGSYARVGGTSFASPQVTGVVAQMLQVNPRLSPIQIRRILRNTASQSHNPDNRMGWGVVNAGAAIQAAERWARSHPPAHLMVEKPYPNPTARQVTIPVRVPGVTDRIDVSLVSPLGRTVAEKKYTVHPGPNWLSMELQSVPPGLYQYQVQGRRNTHRGTIAIRR